MIEAVHGDSRDVLDNYPDDHFDAVVTDGPYALVSIAKRFSAEDAAPAQFGRDGAYQRASAGFMGQKWDTGETVFSPAFWAEVLRVLKPGGHLLSFGGTRSSHRMVCAIEDAGFEIRDSVAWLYGTGFPKSHDVSKGIDKAAGAKRAVVGNNPNHRAKSGVDYEGVYAGANTGAATVTTPATDNARQWEGWGTALKPAFEPVCVARKPLIGTVADNVLHHGTGALNIDACRILGEKPDTTRGAGGQHGAYSPIGAQGRIVDDGKGRWPANVIHDGSDEVLEAFALYGDRPGQLRSSSSSSESPRTRQVYGKLERNDTVMTPRGDAGTAARFFYSAKATKRERRGSKHPTVKPTALLRYLCRLVTPPGGLILDPFAGSGTTLEAAYAEGFSCVGIEREAEYVADIRNRIAALIDEDPLS